MRNAETERGHHSRLITSPRRVVAGKIIIFTNISCGARYKTLAKHKEVVEQMNVHQQACPDFLFRQSHHHLRYEKSQENCFFVFHFGLPCNTGSELFSCQSTVHEGAVARLTRETVLPKAHSVKQNLWEGVFALKS